MELRKGQKIPLNDDILTIKFMRSTDAIDIDTSAFLVGENGKVSGDDDFVFYSNPKHYSGGVVYGDDTIKVDLTKIPRHVERIALTATIYEADTRRQNFSQIDGAVLKIFSQGDSEIATFKLDNFTVETAIVLGEIYRYKGAWKFNATGAGFKGGLEALCKNFGIEITDEVFAPPPPPEPPKPKKIELRKGQKINLSKKEGSVGEIVINLNWSQPEKKSGFLNNIFGNKGIDLDLCCLYEMKNGEIGAIQALGNLFGTLKKPPYIALDGDDRTGSVAQGETIRVNGRYINKIRRVLVYTFIYSGAANWNEARGVVTVKCQDNPELVVRMDEYGSKQRTCAIALLENIGGTFSVEKIVKFYRDAQEMDEDFDWGLRWTVGRKD